MGKKIARITVFCLWSMLLVCLLCAGLYNYALPETITVASGEDIPSYPCVSLVADEDENSASGVSFMDARLFGVISLKKIEVKNYEGLSLIPSGRTFGVRLFGEGVCVVGVAEVTSGGKSVSPATLAGLATKDLILSVNDSPVKTVTDLKTAVENSMGAPLSIRYRRGDSEKNTVLTPVFDETDGKYKMGMWVKDSATGIGTVSFINPETGEFGALGHGVCDAESGTLLPLKKGVVTDAVVTDIVAGCKGKPGEVKGYLKTGKTGVLLKNSECGVFGVFTAVPKEEALPIAPSSSVKTGKATLRTMLDGECPVDYEIEITEVHGKSPNKSFTVRVTDPRLLSKTGGIIQGMSGSPIIQNGKLIGAVTHVMINDPTHGYGIFIENMLNQMDAK
ncbi:MAG: SpoIVB peptidase [Ruminococcaceae bacterium]|nr:SpoIVB peptidase [Oscillospiraceae bacterium]